VTGATGPTGVFGTTVVRTNDNAATLRSDDILPVVVACDAGEVLLGGGFMVEAEVNRQIDLAQVIPIQSGPTAQPPNGWGAQIIATANTGLVTLHAFVFCAVP
jgi:hypothetical protein